MPPSGKGLIHVASSRSVVDTLKTLEVLAEARGLKVFARVDHSGEAEKVGLKMPLTQLLIFGSPQAGTPLMIAAPSLAIDLPLKTLVWEGTQGRVWLSYNDPDYLKQRHGIPEGLLKNIAGIGALVEKAAE